ncbi:hypothetical protein CDAR_259181 [Caerostris darwini]|uniref:Uncharacterized protein n=1 Tax=Caerostris darwini TaxID=1538125 RepID=A0AAV4MBV4_9ARAC|nr:hypothetical protein CDAR_259181 [Caerostris darwini]
MHLQSSRYLANAFGHILLGNSECKQSRQLMRNSFSVASDPKQNNNTKKRKERDRRRAKKSCPAKPSSNNTSITIREKLLFFPFDVLGWGIFPSCCLRRREPNTKGGIRSVG